MNFLKFCIGILIWHCSFELLISASHQLHNDEDAVFEKLLSELDYQQNASSMITVDKIKSALQNVLAFLESNYEAVNVDGLFGIRIAEGIFANFATYKIDSTLKSELNAMFARLQKLGSDVFANVAQNTPDYTQNFNTLIGKAYDIKSQSYKLLDFKSLSKIKMARLVTTSFNEQFSDACYSTLLEKYEDQANNCRTNDDCLNYYTQSNASGSLKKKIHFCLIVITLIYKIC